MYYNGEDDNVYQNHDMFEQRNQNNNEQGYSSVPDDAAVEIRAQRREELRDATEHIKVRKSRYHQLMEQWDNKVVWPKTSSSSRNPSKCKCSKVLLIVTGICLLAAGVASYIMQDEIKILFSSEGKPDIITYRLLIMSNIQSDICHFAVHLISY